MLLILSGNNHSIAMNTEEGKPMPLLQSNTSIPKLEANNSTSVFLAIPTEGAPKKANQRNSVVWILVMEGGS